MSGEKYNAAWCSECGAQFIGKDDPKAAAIQHRDETGHTVKVQIIKLVTEVYFGDNPYKCDWCGDRFKYTSDMNNHMNFLCNRKPKF